MRIDARISTWLTQLSGGVQGRVVLDGPLGTLLIIGQPLQSDSEVIGSCGVVGEREMSQSHIQVMEGGREPVSGSGRLLTSGNVDHLARDIEQAEGLVPPAEAGISLCGLRGRAHSLRNMRTWGEVLGQEPADNTASVAPMPRDVPAEIHHLGSQHIITRFVGEALGLSEQGHGLTVLTGFRIQPSGKLGVLGGHGDQILTMGTAHMPSHAGHGRHLGKYRGDEQLGVEHIVQTALRSENSGQCPHGLAVKPRRISDVPLDAGPVVRREHQACCDWWHQSHQFPIGMQQLIKPGGDIGCCGLPATLVTGQARLRDRHHPGERGLGQPCLLTQCT